MTEDLDRNASLVRLSDCLFKSPERPQNASRAIYYPLGYNPALDGLRALAVLPVLLFHGGSPGFHWGYIGVDLFFVISGYLITSTLLKEYAERRRISLLEFYRRRALRLLPALAFMCLSVLVFMGLALNSWEQGLREIVVVAFYISNWTRTFDPNFPLYLGHTWSLAVEEQFYILWPLVLLMMLSFTRNPVALVRIILALIAAVAVWRVGLLLRGVSAERIYNGTDTRADSLLVGAGLAIALATPRLAKGVLGFSSRIWPLASVGIVALPMFLNWKDAYMALGGFTIVASAAAVVFAAATTEGVLPKFLSRPLIVWIGRRSYGLYLWHYPVMLAAILHFHVERGLVLSMIECALAFLLAAISYRFIEQLFLERRYATVCHHAFRPDALDHG